MRFYGGFAACACAALCALSSPLFSARADAPSQTSAPPAETRLLTERLEVNAQGLATDTVHLVVRANNAAAAQKIGQQPVGYSDSLDDLEIVSAFTEKADGRKIPVAASAIYTQLPQGENGQAMLDDQKQKLVIFPDVESGDSIDLTFRRHEKAPSVPGGFMLERIYPRQIPFDAVEITLVAPKSLALFTQTKEMAFDRHDEGANTVYHWRYAAPVPAAPAGNALSAFDAAPHLLVSSFKDYDAFAHSFAGLIAPQLRVTPKIQALADQLTAGIADRRLAAQKLYEWVSLHIRYVGIEMGVGAIVPHDADAVLANGYGDCKDHVALYSALLKAKGIASEFVLINQGASYALPAIAVLGELNHAITFIPELDVYADTTAGVAPFGTLAFPEYGKPVVHAVASGPALRRMPILPPGLATISTSTVASLDTAGRIAGTSSITATGPFSLVLRLIGLNIQAAGASAADQILKNANVQGTGAFDVPSPTSLAPAYTLGSSWTFGPFAEILQGKRFAMLFGINVLGVPGDNLVGSLFANTLTDTSTIPCFSGHAEESVELHAPPGWHFLALPPDLGVQTQHINFVTHWQVQGATLHYRRAFTSTLDVPYCGGERRAETNRALDAIRKVYAFGAAVAPDAMDKPMASNGDLRVAMGADGFVPGAAPQAGSAAPVALADLAAASLGAKELALADAVAPASSPVATLMRAETVTATAPVVALAPAPSGRASLVRDERAATTALAAKPADASLYEQRGRIRVSLARYDDAAADFGKAAELAAAPKDKARALAGRGNALWMARDYRPSLAAFDAAVNCDASNEAALAGRGRSELFAGKYDRAIADLARAATLSRDPAAALLLYVADQRAGRDGRADLMAHLSSLDLAAGPGPLVPVFLGQAHGAGSDQPGAAFYLGELALSVGDKTTAAALFHQAAAAGNPESVAAAIELETLAH